jgi:hypothetical protein
MSSSFCSWDRIPVAHLIIHPFRDQWLHLEEAFQSGIELTTSWLEFLCILSSTKHFDRLKPQEVCPSRFDGFL